ncbi:hypothetical protein SLEP1_g22343 [Rubroshorea leprosula]|uniref:Uncharacterized protein n=1 Tax=Rubroshorea leprosula TaxID=152421 RepID=A0AAV5JHQ3_9ROSI|nr:hypothetical protein SLEP1_g22343 [Rubroshorea leprosula]
MVFSKSSSIEGYVYRRDFHLRRCLNHRARLHRATQHRRDSSGYRTSPTRFPLVSDMAARR